MNDPFFTRGGKRFHYLDRHKPLGTQPNYLDRHKEAKLLPLAGRYMETKKMVDEIMMDLPPITVPVEVKDARVPSTVWRLDTPGIEVDFEHPNGHVYFIIPLVIADFDYKGQAGFFQIALRGEDPNNVHVFGEYRYFFAYRGTTLRGAAPNGPQARRLRWENWHTDINFGTERPSYATFGAYLDEPT